MRALYDSAGGEPSRRSDWVITGDYNIEPLELPGRPELNKGDSWLQLEENSYQLEFHWLDPRRCHPSTGYQVQQREYLGQWNGIGTPPTGTVFWSNGRSARWDPATMTLDGTWLWTK